MSLDLRRWSGLALDFLALLAVAAVGVAVISVPLYEKKVWEAHQARVDRLASTLNEAALQRRFDFIVDVLKEVSHERSIAYTTLVRQGHYYAHSDPAQVGEPVPPEDLPLTIGGARVWVDPKTSVRIYTVAVPLTRFQDETGAPLALEVGFSLREFDAHRREIYGALTVVVLLIGIIAILFLSLKRNMDSVDRLKSEFVSNVSHELRTPLTAIKGAVDNMLDGITGPLTPRQESYLQKIRRNYDDLEGLIADLLDISKIEAGRMEVRCAPTRIQDVAEECRETMAPLAEKKGLTLELQIPEACPPVQADRSRLRQVLLNLLGNAVKFTDAGRVELSAMVTGRDLQITVLDTGPGIDPQDLERVFDKFFQGEGPRRAGGAGLGLAIAQKLITLQEGRLWVESKPGHGSRFHILLPLAEEGRDFHG